MSLTTQQKYNWLLEQLEVVDIDYWEQDASVVLKKRLFFQFDRDCPPEGCSTMDENIIKCIDADAWNKRNVNDN